jgi:hypothetical protein
MKKQVLFEDAAMYYNKWVSGIASGELASQKLSIKDILNKNDEHLEQNPNLTKAEPVMPYPIPNAVSVLGELITSLSSALNLFRLSLKNPALENKKGARIEIILIIKHLKLALHVINKLILKLQKSVESKK